MIDAPPAFYKFCEAIIQDIGMFKTKADFFSFALRRMTQEQRTEFADFISRYNDGEISDIQMETFFNRSQTDFYIPNPDGLRHFLTEAASYTKKPLKAKSDTIYPYSGRAPEDDDGP